MASEKKQPIVGELKADIPAEHFFSLIRTKLKEFYPKHLESEYYLLDKYTILDVASGHIGGMECLLKKNPEMAEDVFYDKEKTIKLDAIQSKSIQTDMDAFLIALIEKKVHVDSKADIAWERGQYVKDDSKAIAGKLTCKIELAVNGNGEE
jgi:hypothetical protein